MRWRPTPEPACRDELIAEHEPVLVSRHGRGVRPVDEAEHGLESTYGNWQCRCRPCRRAHAAYTYRKRARARSTDAA